MELDYHPLKELAFYAAEKRIRGGSFKRNSLLKPLDIVLTELDRCPDIANAHELALVYRGSQGLLYDHLRRISKGIHEEDIYHYVDLFFQGVLNIDMRKEYSDSSKEQRQALIALKQRVDELLQRERLLRSAYLVYIRQKLAEIRMQRGKAKTLEEAMQALQASEEQEDDLEDEA